MFLLAMRRFCKVFLCSGQANLLTRSPYGISPATRAAVFLIAVFAIGCGGKSSPPKPEGAAANSSKRPKNSDAVPRPSTMVDASDNTAHPIPGENLSGGTQSVAASPPPDLPPPTSTRFDSTLAKATYVGAQACEECHQDQFAHFQDTLHSRSLRETDSALEPADGEFLDAKTGRSYRAYRDQGALRHSESIAAGGKALTLADHPLNLTVGSGAHAHTYLVSVDGFFVESPLTWYSGGRSWALSPGYEVENAGFARPVYFDCLFCHSGRVESVDGGRAKFNVRQLAIDCERCHGPGSEHVAHWQTAVEMPADGDTTIVNPERLPRRENESVCGQCHLDAEAKAPVRGRHIGQFLAGKPLDEYRTHFTLTSGRAAMRVVGHGEQLRLSRCYNESQTLTCTTCHTSHAPPAEDKPAFYRRVCLECHQEDSCGLSGQERRQSADDRCTTCHMPPSNTEVPHVAATHHRIAVYRPNAIAGEATATGAGEANQPAEDGELRPLADLSWMPALDRERCQGLAHLALSLRLPDREQSDLHRVRAREVLEDVRRQGMRDGDTLAALATIYQAENPQRAIELGREALRTTDLAPEARVQALAAISSAQIGQKRIDQAVSSLGLLVGLRRQGADWFLLAVCRYQTGDIPGALAAAQRAAQIRPDQARVQELLAELYRHDGQVDLAAQAEEAARAIRSAASQ